MCVFGGSVKALAGVIFFLSFCSIPLVKGQIYGDSCLKAIDSVSGLLPSLRGSEKWNAYSKLERLYCCAGQPDDHCGFLRKYVSEAHREGNVAQEAHSRTYLAISYFNYNKLDSLEVVLPGTKKFLLRHDLLDKYFRVAEIECLHHLSCSDVDTALSCSQQMYDTASETGNEAGKGTTLSVIGQVYHAMGRLKESAEAYKEAIILLEKNNIGIQTTFRSYHQLLAVLIALEEYDEAMKYCRTMEKKTLTFEKEARDEGADPHTDDIWLFIHLRYGMLYTHIQEFKKAEQYLRKAEENPFSSHGLVMSEILFRKAHLFKMQGKYREALAALQQMQAINAATPAGASNVVTTLQDMADVAYQAKEYALSAAYYKRLVSANDSLRSAEYDHNIDELRTVYEVDKLTAEKERQTLVIFLAVGICIFLFVIAVVSVDYSRRLRIKNISLYRQIKEKARTEEAVSKVFTKIPENELSRHMKLFKELSLLMHTEKLFKDPELDRKAVASRLGTNEKYLANAIHEGAEVTFYNYILDLRLSYSLQLLSSGGNMSLDTVASESGFGSYSPFYRAFVKKYGMGPSDYRKLSATQIEKL